MISRNPLLIIVLNFLVGFLISHGYASAEQKNDLVNAFADVIGVAMIFITSLFSLAHIWKTGHIHMPSVTQTPITRVNPPTEPLLPSDQEPLSDKLFSHRVE